MNVMMFNQFGTRHSTIVLASTWGPKHSLTREKHTAQWLARTACVNMRVFRSCFCVQALGVSQVSSVTSKSTSDSLYLDMLSHMQLHSIWIESTPRDDIKFTRGRDSRFSHFKSCVSSVCMNECMNVMMLNVTFWEIRDSKTSSRSLHQKWEHIQYPTFDRVSSFLICPQ